MAPTKHKLAKTNVGEEVLDLVIPYIHNVDDRNSVSLVSRKCYETDGITRKRVTVHTLYSSPSRLSERFPFIESLTLKGPPLLAYYYDIRIIPWIQEFSCLKELHFHRMAVYDEDLETLARTRGKDLRILKIKKCKRFSTDGLRHVSNYCNQLKTLCLEYCIYNEVKDGIWLHQLALNSTVLERLHVTNVKGDIYDEEDLTLLAKNCCNSLISLKIGACYLSKLGDAFRYAVRLETFSSGYFFDEESELVRFQFPPNIRSLSIGHFAVTRYSIGTPFLNHINFIKKLKLASSYCDRYCHCFLVKRCPNLEVLYTKDLCGDKGLQVIGQFCKKLRKLTHVGDLTPTHVGLIALAKGCTELECLKVGLGDISDEAIKCLGMHLKNLRKFHMELAPKKDGSTLLPLDNGIRAMLLGCTKLERLDISLSHLGFLQGELTDVGLEYIAKYGANLRSVSLNYIGVSNAGLVKLSEGCPRLRKLILRGCPLSKQVVASCVFNIPSLRYVWGFKLNNWALTRPGFQL